MTLRRVTPQELAEHNTESSCWTAIDGIVYDVTKFMNSHPGGKSILMTVAGKDSTAEFFELHRKSVLSKFGPKLAVGALEKPGAEPLQAMPDYDASHKEIDIVTPFAEHPALRQFNCPFYSVSHLVYWRDIRKRLVSTYKKEADEFDLVGKDPSPEVMRSLGAQGIIAAHIGKMCAPFLERCGLRFPVAESLKLEPSKFDYFFSLITQKESYMGCPSYSDGLFAGLNIGLPPVIRHGKPHVQEQVIPLVLRGEERIALAISEPSAGSDVAGIQTTAVLSADKQHYVINGVKKWITGGDPARFFSTAIRSEGKGHGGISMILVDRHACKGVTTKKLKTAYDSSAGTAMVYFDNAMVPVDNLLGRPGQGFKIIVANFNHERWMLMSGFLGMTRRCVADCYRWSLQRKAFGKRLIEQPVVRFHLAEMSAIIDVMDNWADDITHHMNTMSYAEQTERLGGPIALLKFYITRQALIVADKAAQILGGRGLTKTGMGDVVEKFNRYRKYPAIYAGSEEILADLAVRQSLAHMNKALKQNPAGVMISRL